MNRRSFFGVVLGGFIATRSEELIPMTRGMCLRMPRRTMCSIGEAGPEDVVFGASRIKELDLDISRALADLSKQSANTSAAVQRAVHVAYGRDGRTNEEEDDASCTQSGD